MVGQQHGAWAAFAFDDNGTPTCYAAARAATKNGDSFIYITHRPTEKALGVFQFLSPVALQAGSAARLMVDKKTFALFTTATSAFARGAGTDRAITDAIRRGHKVSVTFTPAGSKETTVAFETKGSSLALQAINRMCGLD